MTARSPEPLSEEPEKLIDRTLGVFAGVLMGRDDLRAFAREIYDLCEHQCQYAQAAEYKAKFLASQESAKEADKEIRSLSENLSAAVGDYNEEKRKAKALEEALESVRGMIRNAWCDDAETLEMVEICDSALAAYRSPAAPGGGKP